MTVETGAEQQPATSASTPAPSAPQQETSETQQETAEPLPEVSPISDNDSHASNPEPTISDREFQLNPNPLFETDDESAFPDASDPQPALQLPSGIPGPRHSSRTNKNVPPDRYTDDAFASMLLVCATSQLKLLSQSQRFFGIR
jgi:hypothetical protein